MDDLLSRRVASVALNSRSAKIGTPAAPSTGLPKTLKRESPERQPPPSSADSQQLLTVKELADRWNVHPRTIRRKIEAKKIKPIRIGRSVRIHPSVADLGPDDTI